MPLARSPPTASSPRAATADFANEGGATAIGNPANAITNGGVRVEKDGESFSLTTAR
jgi:aconitate hydratase